MNRRPLVNRFADSPMVLEYPAHGQCAECVHPWCVETRRYYLPVVEYALEHVDALFRVMFVGGEIVVPAGEPSSQPSSGGQLTPHGDRRVAA